MDAKQFQFIHKLLSYSFFQLVSLSFIISLTILFELVHMTAQLYDLSNQITGQKLNRINYVIGKESIIISKSTSCQWSNIFEPVIFLLSYSSLLLRTFFQILIYVVNVFFSSARLDQAATTTLWRVHYGLIHLNVVQMLFWIKRFINLFVVTKCLIRLIKTKSFRKAKMVLILIWRIIDDLHELLLYLTVNLMKVRNWLQKIRVIHFCKPHKKSMWPKCVIWLNLTVGCSFVKRT